MKLTEAKLKQLIKEVLNESANSLADLPEGVYVSVEKHPSYRSFIIRYVNEEGRSTSKEFGFKGILVIGEPQLSDDYPCENAFAIEWAVKTLHINMLRIVEKNGPTHLYQSSIQRNQQPYER